MSSENRHAQRSAETRRKLVAAGRALFAEHGYAEVGTEAIVRAAGVTRGALYHQFEDKAELLAAVVEELETEVSRQIAEGAIARAHDPISGLLAGAEAFLRVVTTPEVRQILLVDALPVLGWARWRAIGLRHGLGLVEAVLQGAIDAGLLRPAPVRPLAHLLLGALDEAALYVADADDPDGAREQMLAVLGQLVEGLRA
ncbi:TetR/AcrR family transcriptional regulator [Patulibacter defluvii]|uniref:TetR/AcrR family transcriptional regulator n=1 Tax=Patulibacter defluvii TaxID=3095358 RepID=UPI002A760D2F|nr:TetR/AcrR family transcriptional regulator [Patulibacter sp. DM4]